jgi:uncharacterized membrane protein (UPF0182 family)
MVWIVDGYTTLDNYPYSELTTLSNATIDSNEVAGNRLLLDKKVSYIRNSVKATVDAYDGTVTLYAQDCENDRCSRRGCRCSGTVKPSRTSPRNLQKHLRYPRDLFKVQRALWPSTTSTTGEVLHQRRLLGCATGSHPTAQQLPAAVLHRGQGPGQAER